MMLYYPILTLLLISFSQSLSPYPNCALNIGIKDNNSTNQVSLQFLKLSDFIFERSQNLGVQVIKTDLKGQYSEKLNRQTKKQLIKFTVLGAALMIIILIMTLSKQHQLNKGQPQDKNIRSAVKMVSLCLFFMCIIFMVIFSQFQQNADITSCKIALTNDIITEGSIVYKWEGSQNHIEKLNLVMSLILQFSNQSIYDYSTSTMLDLITKIQFNFKKLKYDFAANASFNQYDNITNLTKIKLGDIMKQIYIQNGLMNKLEIEINKTILILQSCINVSKSLQNIISDRINILQQLKIIQKKLEYYSGYLKENKQFANKYNQDKLLYLKILINSCEIMVILCTISIFIVFMSSFSTTINKNYFSKIQPYIFKFLILILSSQLIIQILLSQTQIFTQSTCHAYNSLMINQTLYRQTFDNSVQQMFSVCIHNDGDYAKEVKSKQYISNIVQLIQRFQTLLFLGKYSLLDFETVFQNINNIISREKSASNFSQLGKLSGIKYLLMNLNNYTLNNVVAQNCYKDHWVIDFSSCTPGQNIYSNLQPNSYLSSNFSTAKTICRTFNRYDEIGKVNRIISIGQLASLYISSKNYCPISFNKILSIADQIILDLSLRNKIFTLYEADLTAFQQSLFNVTKQIRTFYYIKMSQYQQTILKTIDNSSISLINLKTISNCSSIKYHLESLYQTGCVELRVTLRKLYLTLISIIMLTIIIITLIFLQRYFHNTSGDLPIKSIQQRPQQSPIVHSRDQQHQ